MNSTPLTVLVPSRGRPKNARRMARALADTRIADIVLCLDPDDPTLDEYPAGFAKIKRLIGDKPMGLTAWLNRAAAEAVHSPFIGFMGDDHLPQTVNWDARICEALVSLGTGIVYGDDLLQGEALPTAVFMTRDITQALGFMAPPCLDHMYCDNFWFELGVAIDRIKYMPDVVIEHLHHGNGKAQFDGRYQVVEDKLEKDKKAYGKYMAERFEDDVKRVKIRCAL